jgi:hypothetical protein
LAAGNLKKSEKGLLSIRWVKISVYIMHMWRIKLARDITKEIKSRFRPYIIPSRVNEQKGRTKET